MRNLAILAAFCASVAPYGATLPAQSVHATHVISHSTNGDAGGGVFQPSNALGAPSGGGAGVGTTHVHSLGVGGSLTLGFGVTIVDGPGEDLVVAENPFYQAGLSWRTFAEVAFVEVSTDGVTFARFPAKYLGPATAPGPFGSVIVGGFDNLAGSTPVFATSSADAASVAAGGGDAFDLADLANDPAVLAGTVDLQAIHEVRFVDVRSGLDLDSRGVAILDSGTGSADIDAVTVLNHTGNVDAWQPTVDLSVPLDGRFRITISDPNTVFDLVAIETSLFGWPVPAGDVLGSLALVQFQPTHVVLELNQPLPADVRFQLAVSVRDANGNACSAQAVRPDGL